SPGHHFVVIVRDVAPRLVGAVDGSALRVVAHDRAYVGEGLARVNLRDDRSIEDGVSTCLRIAMIAMTWADRSVLSHLAWRKRGVHHRRTAGEREYDR